MRSLPGVRLLPIPAGRIAPGLNATKPGAGGSGRLPAQPCSPEDKGVLLRECGPDGRSDQAISEVFGCGGGAAGAGTWGQVTRGTFRGVRGT